MPVTFVNRFPLKKSGIPDPARLPLVLNLEPVASGLFKRRQAWLMAAGKRLARVRWKRDENDTIVMDVLQCNPCCNLHEAALEQILTLRLVSEPWTIDKDQAGLVKPDWILCSGQRVTTGLLLYIPELDAVIGRAVYAYDKSGRKFVRIFSIDDDFATQAGLSPLPGVDSGSSQAMIIVGQTRLSMREILALRPEACIRLDGLVTHPVRLALNGVDWLEGVVSEYNGWLAVRVTGQAGETPLELHELEDEIFPEMLKLHDPEEGCNPLVKSFVNNAHYPEDISRRLTNLLAGMRDSDIKILLEELIPDVGVIIIKHIPVKRVAKLFRILSRKESVALSKAMTSPKRFMTHIVGRIFDAVTARKMHFDRDAARSGRAAML